MKKAQHCLGATLTLSSWKVSSRKRLSSGVSSTKYAAAFSSRYFRRLVPGMGNTSGPYTCSHLCNHRSLPLRCNPAEPLLTDITSSSNCTKHSAHHTGTQPGQNCESLCDCRAQGPPVHAPMQGRAGRACTPSCQPAPSRSPPRPGSSQRPLSGNEATATFCHSPCHRVGGYQPPTLTTLPQSCRVCPNLSIPGFPQVTISVSCLGLRSGRQCRASVHSRRIRRRQTCWRRESAF